jgi:enamine deaminase RidA (YjgF/YER057c/UK114 family)
MITRIRPDTLHKHPAYSQVAVVSASASLVFVGGQNGVDTDGKVVAKDLAGQTVQTMKNVVAALSAAGASMRDVFKLTIYLVQGQSFQEGFAAARPFLVTGAEAPTVSGMMVAGLANPEFLIEVEAVAAIPPGGQA